jgi:hypothetical protein
MRGIDCQLAQIAEYHWMGFEHPNIPLCPLLADLDKLLVYLDDIGLTPGYAVNPCPACGEEHRWALLKHLMISALRLRPATRSRLLGLVDTNLEPVRALYGGEEGFQAMRAGAAEFFAKVESNITNPQLKVERARRKNTAPVRSEKLRSFLNDET